MLHEELEEVRYYVERTRQNYGHIEAADTAQTLRDAWEDFLGSFSKAIGKMIGYGKLDPNLRPWANKLKNASTKDDEGLLYLREARNCVEHGLKPFAKFEDPLVDVAGVMDIKNGNVIITNCNFNSQPIDQLYLNVQQGRVTEKAGCEAVSITEHAADVLLAPVYNEEKGKEYPVPTMIGGNTIVSKTPTKFAHLAMSKLDELAKEFSQG
ncbi:hypothetical protein [Roseovarius sp. EL26]|uniref:hypothetical protein n=1 Tax=Roseovarius sp. EL26 TaxID=2126672 RepID=UPI000EA028AD|nr:hypothetical protein [Roseovarius sp. EL26]